MNKLTEYLEREIGIKIQINENKIRLEKKLPLYLTAVYQFNAARLLDTEIVLIRLKNQDELPTVGQIRKQMDRIREIINMPLVLVFDYLEGFKRRRMVQQKINFIVPFKQLFIPELMMTFTEQKLEKGMEEKHFTPIAQLMAIYWLLSTKEDKLIEGVPFNQLAGLFETNAMAISRAAYNLAKLDICTVHPGRPKHLSFNHNKIESWNIIKERQLWIHPVLKMVFTELKPPYNKWTNTNTDALSVFTDINPDYQHVKAIDKADYHMLKKTNQWPQENASEGEFAIEIWKYNPALLHNKFSWLDDNADPLSLYFCFADDKDERIENALEQIEKKFIYG